jgi:hypothetical protein
MRAVSKEHHSLFLINGIGFVISKETRMKKDIKKKKRQKLVVRIDVSDMGDGQYYVDTEQLSDIPIPLTKLEMTTPEINNPVAQKELKQTIADAKTYIQKLAKILRREVTIKVNRF